MYFLGVGIDCDQERVVEFYKKVVECGDVYVFYFFGMVEIKGDGIEVNEKVGLEKLL